MSCGQFPFHLKSILFLLRERLPQKRSPLKTGFPTGFFRSLVLLPQQGESESFSESESKATAYGGDSCTPCPWWLGVWIDQPTPSNPPVTERRRLRGGWLSALSCTIACLHRSLRNPCRYLGDPSSDGGQGWGLAVCSILGGKKTGQRHQAPAPKWWTVRLIRIVRDICDGRDITTPQHSNSHASVDIMTVIHTTQNPDELIIVVSRSCIADADNIISIHVST